MSSTGPLRMPIAEIEVYWWLNNSSTPYGAVALMKALGQPVKRLRQPMPQPYKLDKTTL